ncbi:hypothetical protein LTR62_003408 [Meristemomyces frigidus]|uniref:Ribosomal protein S2 n=1 Tax=Meristemomyces frigidus TaxID=1508187 RepID=A0AAN7YKR4_9PEZI|nr:hypothetical protein LTR62_003408 [Meristemomyces frigidus]
MILRSLLLRQGRFALPRSTLIRPFRRYLASQIEETYTNPHQHQQFIAGADGDATKSQAATSLSAESEVLDNDPVALNYALQQHSKAVTGKIGSMVEPHYRPHELLSNPPSPKDITLELLMASQSHIGHSTSLWHPANAKYIFGVRGEDGHPIHIISLDVTAAHLRRACKVVSGVTERGGLVLFVGSREGQARCVVNAASMSKGCHLFTKWIPGTITNGQQILGKCKKKVVNHKDEEVKGFEDQLIQKAAVKPDLVVCLNPLENYVLLHECALNNIPTVGIVDTDVNPTWITYPIPANDDSLRCVQLIAGVLGRAGQEGQAVRRELALTGQLPARQDHGLEPPAEQETDERNSRDKEHGRNLLQAGDV